MNSAPVTATDPVTDTAAWLCSLLQASDTAYPTGSYAHSFGLEGLVQLGVVHDRGTLREFLLLAVLPALRQTELPLAAHAWHALGDPLDWPRVGELCTLAHALKTAREARVAADNIGRQRVELAASLHAHPLARTFLAQAAAGGWPHTPAIAAALEARVLGAPLTAALATLFYAGVSGPITAAMKLLRLGQQGAQSLLTEVLDAAPDAIAHAETVPLADIGWSNPWLDIAAARHESSDFRLFIS